MKTLHGQMSCGKMPDGSAQRVDPASRSKTVSTSQAVGNRRALVSEHTPAPVANQRNDYLSLLCAAIKPDFPNYVKGGTETSR
jgi:hypothetical protein